MLHLSQTRKYNKQKALGLKVCARDELHYKKGFYLFGVFCLFVCFCFCFQKIVQSWGLKCNQISCNRSQRSSLLYRIEIKPSDKCSGIETHEHKQGVKGCVDHDISNLFLETLLSPGEFLASPVMSPVL